MHDRRRSDWALLAFAQARKGVEMAINATDAIKLRRKALEFVVNNMHPGVNSCEPVVCIAASASNVLSPHAECLHTCQKVGLGSYQRWNCCERWHQGA